MTPQPSRDITVAVVDDHRLVLEGIVATLEAAGGLSVRIAVPSWNELLAHEAFPTDVVVLDLHLGDPVGIRTKLRALAAAGARTVVISRHADAQTISIAMHAGALAFVPKSDSSDDLVATIRRAHEGTLHSNPHVRSALSDQCEDAVPRLGAREHRALALFAGGRPVKEVALLMDTTEDTVKSYIKRARQKYKRVGIDVGTRALLRRQGVSEGWVRAE